MDRPKLPEYMEDVMACYTDLVRDGKIRWGEFAEWADEHGLQDREYVWDVINKARTVVDEWHSSKAKSSNLETPTPPAQTPSRRG